MIAATDPVMLWRPWWRWVMGGLLAFDVARVAGGERLSWSSLLIAIGVASWLGHDWGVWAQRKADRPLNNKCIARVVLHALRTSARESKLPWGIRHLYTAAMGVWGSVLLSALNERERAFLLAFGRWLDGVERVEVEVASCP